MSSLLHRRLFIHTVRRRNGRAGYSSVSFGLKYYHANEPTVLSARAEPDVYRLAPEIVINICHDHDEFWKPSGGVDDPTVSQRFHALDPVERNDKRDRESYFP